MDTFPADWETSRQDRYIRENFIGHGTEEGDKVGKAPGNVIVKQS